MQMSEQDSGAEQTVDREVDARGLNCPLPILRAKKALNDLQSGQLLKVIATDPSSKRDFEAFARQTGHRLVRVDEAGREWSFFLQRR
jgi:tRNA 2-thiouridine synthesizing protein A